MTTWNHTQWVTQDAEVRARALRRVPGSRDERRVLVRFGRSVLRQYSTSFFIVTRFLPPLKRAQVDMIYAAVRYPDEIVDTLPFDAAERRRLLAQWRRDYDAALKAGSIRDALLQGLPVILAGMAQVTRETGLPPEYYHSFLDAMEADIAPRPFRTLDDLVNGYIYGSATVVGYFLVYVYGSTTPRDFQRAMDAARELAIALQLTNFLRDVNEDHSRGRLYLPQDMLAEHGFTGDFATQAGRKALETTVRDLARHADRAYAQAHANLDAFAPDCRLAIESCIRVYGELNRRVANGATVLERRESVPLRRKLSVLPSSKYWRLPLAWMGLEPA